MKTKFVFHFTPLITETAENNEFASSLSANRSCIRNDEKTIEQQAFISDENQLTIYKILTESIQNKQKL
jgi:hypothetical protein